MAGRKIALRLAWVAVAVTGTSGWKHLIDGPTQRTRAVLEIQYRIIETYRRIHARLPTLKETVHITAYTLLELGLEAEALDDGWGRSLRICQHGKTLVLLSRGPNGVDDGGGVDDLSIEIEP